MANTIKIKRNVTNGDAPTTSDIAKGEIGFTESTQKLYYRDNSDNIREIGGSGSFVPKSGGTFSGNVTIGSSSDLTVEGNLTVSGTTVTNNVSTYTTEDPLVKYANNNAADTKDIGFYGQYNDGSSDLYAGLVRDASNSGKFILFQDTQAEPTTTVNTSGTGYAKGTLIANIEGNLAGSPTITSATVSGSLDMNGTELILDQDANSSITADTDDQIDIKIGGNDEYKITAAALTPAANNTNTLGTNSLRWNAAHLTNIYIGGTQVTSTAAELNIMDGGTSATATTLADGDRAVVNDNGTMKQVQLTDFTTYFEGKMSTLASLNATVAELNIMDGDTTATATTVANEDRVVMNDNGTMVQVAVTDLDTYFSGTTKSLDNKTIDCGTF